MFRLPSIRVQIFILLSKLPDKEEKIKTFYEGIRVEPKKRNEYEKLCSLFGNFNVNESTEKMDKLNGLASTYISDSLPRFTC